MNELDILANYKKEPLTEIYQLKMSENMKKKIFMILKERNLTLSMILRSYIEKIIYQYENS
jgi:hypothetical protein